MFLKNVSILVVQPRSGSRCRWMGRFDPGQYHDRTKYQRKVEVFARFAQWRDGRLPTALQKISGQHRICKAFDVADVHGQW